MKVPVFHAGVRNTNDRIYTKSCLEAALAKIPKPLVIYKSMEAAVAGDLSGVVGTAEMSLEGDEAVATLVFTEPKLEALITEGKLAVRSSGVGSIGSDGVVANDYELTALFLTDTPA
jgi:hypothetical protein